MGQLGVLFSLDENTINKLKSYQTDEERLTYVQEELEVDYFANHPEWIAELDKSWDALHRSLTDGELEWSNGEFPLNHVILGGEQLYEEEDYIMTLKTPAQVTAIARAVDKLSREELHARYLAINEATYGVELSEEDFNYTWEWFQNAKPFWQKAAQQQRYVLFTADQ